MPVFNRTMPGDRKARCEWAWKSLLTSYPPGGVEMFE
jgi:hypothetical protein